jgi:hypothetical protein
MVPLPDHEVLHQELAQWLQIRGFRGSLGDSMAEDIVEYIIAREPLVNPHELTEEEKFNAREIFEGKIEGRQACIHCAGLHGRVAGLSAEQQPCPRVKRVHRHTDGATILEVEYWPNGDWEEDVIFPEDVYGDGREDTE